MSDHSTLARPLLVIVSGKPGAGKSTLARRLGDHDALEVPVLSRDALKAGLEETVGMDEAARLRGVIVPRSFDLFFQTIDTWLRAGVSLIAEYSFTRTTPLSSLQALTEQARIVVVHCETTDQEAAVRLVPRERGRAHLHSGQIEAIVEQMQAGTFDWGMFQPPDLGGRSCEWTRPTATRPICGLSSPSVGPAPHNPAPSRARTWFQEVIEARAESTAG
jgi:predicted kinase